MLTQIVYKVYSLSMKTPGSTNALSITLRVALKGKNTNAADLSVKMSVAYDCLRRIVKGFTYPSQVLLGRLCVELELDLDEMLYLYRLSKAADLINETDRSKEAVDNDTDEPGDPKAESLV